DAIFAAAGDYKIAIAFFQGGGGASMEARFSPAGGGLAYNSQTIINPGGQSTIFRSPTGTPGQLLEQFYNGVNTTSFLDPGTAVNATLTLSTGVTTTRNVVI